jgi:hypothetical protein
MGCGLMLNAIGATLLLICHFPWALPSGDPPSLLTAEGSVFWHWANGVGSGLGLVLTLAGIYLQYRASRARPSVMETP